MGFDQGAGLGRVQSPSQQLHGPSQAEDEGVRQVVADGNPVAVPLLVVFRLAADIQHLVDLEDVPGQGVAPRLDGEGLRLDLVVLDGAEDVRFVLRQLVDLEKLETLHVRDDVVDHAVDPLVLQDVPEKRVLITYRLTV